MKKAPGDHGSSGASIRCRYATVLCSAASRGLANESNKDQADKANNDQEVSE